MNSSAMIITPTSSLLTIRRGRPSAATCISADKFGRPYNEELHRVIIHGILHLCGLNDKAPGERQMMEAAEDKALAMIIRKGR